MQASREAEWRRLAERAIGASADSLTHVTDDGLRIAPLHPRSVDKRPGPWRARQDWSVAQRVDDPKAERANAAALHDLDGGADALTLVFTQSPFARGFGIDPSSLDAALEGVDLDYIGLRLDAGAATPAAVAALGGLVEARRLTSAGLDVDCGFDPIGIEARTGASPSAADGAAVLAAHATVGFKGCPLLADGRPYHEAGASAGQELAAVIATGVAYLRLLEATGRTLDDARVAIGFLLAADSDVFEGIAKFRAMRRLWARIEAASSLDPRPIRLHAETSWRIMTRRDPWTNVMRATAGTVAAGLGGADHITVLPFTLPVGLPDEPARRLARNVQRVLLDEANLGMVDDPAAGSGGLEAVTDALCEKAWALFQDIEHEGGIQASLRAKALPARIAATAAGRARAIATLERGIIGTNRFPSLDTRPVAVLDAQRSPADKSGILPVTRDAEPYEALRDAAERCAIPPNLFLATLGPPAAFGIRATYAANFFAAAGIKASINTEPMDESALITRFKDSGARVACLCGTDAAYAQHAVAWAALLRQAGAMRVLLVGQGEIPGIDAFIHDGCDALQVLGDTLETMAQVQHTHAVTPASS
jgi:methylmalonyl-CoA mutase